MEFCREVRADSADAICRVRSGTGDPQRSASGAPFRCSASYCRPLSDTGQSVAPRRRAPGGRVWTPPSKSGDSSCGVQTPPQEYK